MVIMDVDGVLSDGRMIFDTQGAETKIFNTYDGAGVVYLNRVGIKTAIISGRFCYAVAFRAQELEIKDVYQNAKDKTEALNKLMKKYNLSAEQICYIGDDLPDIPIMRLVGYAVAVRNARPEVKKYAHYVTKLCGGDGAVREVAEKILKAQNKWELIMARYETNK